MTQKFTGKVVELVPRGSYYSSGVCVFRRYLLLPIERGRSNLVLTPLRRILLSEMTCLAIAGVRIEGAPHEFSKVFSLREDILDIILNLKQIVLRGTLDKPVVAKLSYQGPGIITALDIALPEGVEVVDSSQYIATATTGETIKMDFLIKSGKGYSLRHDSFFYDSERFIQIDAVYMPVTRFNFFVETVMSEEPFPEFESLVLEISTNGSITPEDAFLTAFVKLKEIFYVFEEGVVSQLASLSRLTSLSREKKRRRRSGLTRRTKKTREGKERRRRERRESEKIDELDLAIQTLKKEDGKSEQNHGEIERIRKSRTIDEFKEITLEQLGLPVRSNRALQKHGIKTIAKLISYSREDLLALKGVGLKAIEEIGKSLSQLAYLYADTLAESMILSSDLVKERISDSY